MDLYHRRSKIICDIFVQHYHNYITCFTKHNDIYELILDNGIILKIEENTRWNEIVEIMRRKKRKFNEI
jgi:hypothetical protein